MEVLHVSPRFNRESILKNWIHPSKINLEHHLDTFREMNIISPTENKIIYTWESVQNNEKFIKDHVYCIIWLHHRNNLCDKYDGGIDFSKLTISPIYKFNQMIFDIYSSEVEEDDIWFYHEQTPSDDKFSSAYNMNEKYAHTDKPLRVYNKKLKPKLIGKVLYKLEKQGKFTIKIIK